MTTQKTIKASQHLKPTPLLKWYRSPVKLMLALYLATSVGFLAPTLKSLIPIDSTFQNMTGETAGGDFSVFYVAGLMVSDERYDALYQSDSFAAAREQIFTPLDGGKLFFNYPPTAFLLFLPMSKLPYMPSYGLWILLMLTGTALTVYAFTRSKLLTAASLMSPAFLWCIITGQLGFLATIIMGSGLYMLTKGHKMTAGIVLGLLIIKPHMALALPICLIATKQWRTIFGGIISSVTLTLISLLLFGPEPWTALATQLSNNITGHLSAHGGIADRIPTLFVTMMRLTDNETISASIHALGAIIAIASTIYIWRRSYDTTARLITLFVTPALISPYYFDYDLTGLGLVFAVMMMQASTSKPKTSELAALTGIWVISFFMLIGKINLFFTGPVFLMGLLYYAFYRTQKTPTSINHSQA